MKTAAVLLLVAGLAIVVGVSSWRSQDFEPPRPTLPPPPPPLSSAESVEVSQRRLRAAEAALDELRARHAALAEQLDALKEEGEKAKSAVTFSYGTTRESGRFVGRTLRLGLDAALETDPEAARRMRAENRINELSLGPFIRDADLIEADPERFAEFQGGLVSEMLEIEARHEFEVEALLAAFKKESLRVEPGSPTWALLDQNVRERITALMSAEARATKTEHLRFFEYYGMLLIPAYAALGEP
jgi:hypothetical protein